MKGYSNVPMKKGVASFCHHVRCKHQVGIEDESCVDKYTVVYLVLSNLPLLSTQNSGPK